MKNKWPACLVLCLIISLKTWSQEKYNGMDANLSNIYRSVRCKKPFDKSGKF